MKPDFEALVADALAGKPGPLLHALRRMKSPDYPPCVVALLKQFMEIAKPNGRPPDGRPPTGKEQIYRAYRAWWAYLLKYTHEQKRDMARLFKKTGAMELRAGRWVRTSMPPAVTATLEIEEETGLSKNAYDALVYGDRHKKTTQ